MHCQELNTPKIRNALFKKISFQKNKSDPLKKNSIWEHKMGALETCHMLRCSRCLILRIF